MPVPKNILVDVEVESGEDEPLWWATTADVEGFYSAAESLVELMDLVRAALAEIAEDDGDDLPDVSFHLVGAETFGMPPTEPVKRRGAAEANSAGIQGSVKRVPAMALG